MEYEPYDTYFWQTDKIRLRALRPEDALKKCREWTDSEARRFLECQLDLPPASLAAYTEALKAACDFKDTSRAISFAIETLDNEFVGWINYFSGDPRHGVFSLGLGIFREYRGHGYGVDASRLILRYGFDELRCQKCSSACLADNAASIRLHQKLGFQPEGRRRRAYYMAGQYHDELLWGLLKEEFDGRE